MTQSAGLKTGLELTQRQIDDFLQHLAHKGCRKASLEKYRRDLTRFRLMLPEDRCVRWDTVPRWREALMDRGYAPRTINSNVAEVNGLLDFLGHRELQLPGQLDVGGDDQPELTRTEYLRLLSTARLLERERTYLLVKLFATTGIGVQDVPLVTVEAVRDGSVPQAHVRIPAPLRAELLDYCGRMGLTSGPVFVTRTGRTLCRTAIFDTIRRLSRDACVPEEKCSPRCLHRLWLSTQENLAQQVRSLVEQLYEHMLEQEQCAIGWKSAEL